MVSRVNALIIIDMQPAYFKSPTLLRAKDRIVERINALTREVRTNGGMLINIRTAHLRDKSTWTLNMLEDDQGFAFQGSSETQVLPGLDVDGAMQMIKTRDNAFHGTQLLRTLRTHDVTTITLAGVSAHSCIFHTAAAAYAYNLPVRIVTDAVGDEDDDQRMYAFDYLRREYRQEIS
jgi:nicotinamidase-related amidase